VSALSPKEQRELRRIERELLSDDPRIARLLSEPTMCETSMSAQSATQDCARRFFRTSPTSSWPLALRAALVFLSIANLLIVGGFCLGEIDMVLGGILVLGILPLIIVLVMAVGGSQGS
jgi:hypothetical protein